MLKKNFPSFLSSPFKCLSPFALRESAVAVSTNGDHVCVYMRDCIKKHLGLRTDFKVFCLNCKADVGRMYGSLVVFDNFEGRAVKSVFASSRVICADADCINRFCICFAVRGGLGAYNLNNPFNPLRVFAYTSPRLALHDGGLDDAESNCISESTRKVRRYKICVQTLKRGGLSEDYRNNLVTMDSALVRPRTPSRKYLDVFLIDLID